MAFNLSYTVSEPQYEAHEDNFGKWFVYKCTAIVSAPNGREVLAVGACSSRNPFFSRKNDKDVPVQPEDIIMMSQTVALNRAISDMVGSGELSAEEAAGLGSTQSPSPNQSQPPMQTGGGKPAPVPVYIDDKTGEVFDSLKLASDKNVDKILTWLNKARSAGMKDEPYNNIFAAFAPGMTYGDLAKAKDYLLRHHPDQCEDD